MSDQRTEYDKGYEDAQAFYRKKIEGLVADAKSARINAIRIYNELSEEIETLTVENKDLQRRWCYS